MLNQVGSTAGEGQAGNGFMSDITQILSALKMGEGQAAEELLPFIYDELRRLAAWHLTNPCIHPGDAG
jgi:hypothetical protein